MDPNHEYASLREISRELRAADSLASDYGWRRVSVGCKAIEEIAREVQSLLT